MDLDDMKKLAKGMKAVYTSDKFLPDADSVKIWFFVLKDIPYEIANAAVMKYITTNTYPPTIADIRKACMEITSEQEEDWGEGWKKVQKAISKWGMYRQEEALADMPKLTQEAVKRIGWVNLCTSSNEVAERANFRMIYEQLAARKEQDAQIPSFLHDAIADIRNKQQNLLEGGDL